ncbi:MAG: extracellular solute-binding protein [Mycobacterium sp.]
MSPNRFRVAGVSAVVAALVLSATACSTSGSGNGEQDISGPFEPATSGEVNLYTWSNYFPQDVVDRFTAETGITLNIDTYPSNEALEAKLRSTNGAGYDVVVPSDYMAEILIKDGFAKEINAAELPNGSNIAPERLDDYFDPGRKYTSPYLYGTTGFMYDSDVIPVGEAPASWKDYFNPPAAAGQVSVFDDPITVINAALRANGAQTCSKEPADLQAAQDLLMTFKPRVSTVSNDGQTDRMLSGEQSLLMMWNGTAHRIRAQKPSAIYVYPEEGLDLWQDNMMVLNAAENTPQALTLVNWLMDPKNMADIANQLGYNAGLTGMDEYLSPEMKSDPGVVIPAEFADRVAPTLPCDNETRDAFSRIWETFKK